MYSWLWSHAISKVIELESSALLGANLKIFSCRLIQFFCWYCFVGSKLFYVTSKMLYEVQFFFVAWLLRPERKTSNVRCGKRPREIIRKASSLYFDFWPSCFWLVWLLSRFCIYLERVSYHSVMKTLEQFIAINLFWKGWGPLELSMWFKNLSDIFLSCSVMTALLHSQSGSLNVWDSLKNIEDILSILWWLGPANGWGPQLSYTKNW